jgi:hypothetical protein
MLRSLLALGVWFCAGAPVALLAQAPATVSPQAAPLLRSIHISGNKELSDQAVLDALHLTAGQALSETPDHVAERLQTHYRDEGFTFARVKAGFDAASGVLELGIDEGVIEGVEFQGVDEKLAKVFGEEFALRAGDVFHSRCARQALDVLLQPTRGAVSPGRTHAPTFIDSEDLRRRRGTFDLVDRDGQRILVVGLREAAGRFKLVPDLGEREDWFSPVDGFVPSLGMGIAVFDH